MRSANGHKRRACFIDLHVRSANGLYLIAFFLFNRDAEDAVYGKNDSLYEDQRLKVQFPRNSNNASSNSSRHDDRRSYSNSRPRGSYTRGRGRGAPIQRSDNRVAVSGLPPTGSWQDLKDHMREAGEVLYADVYKDGTAVCEFTSHRDMKWAVKYLDDSKFKSHEVSLSRLATAWKAVLGAVSSENWPQHSPPHNIQTCNFIYHFEKRRL